MTALVTLITLLNGGNRRGVEANVLDGDIAVKEFELRLRCYLLFWTNTVGKVMHPLNLPPPPTTIDEIVPVLFFYKSGFGSKSLTKVDMPFKIKITKYTVKQLQSWMQKKKLKHLS